MEFRKSHRSLKIGECRGNAEQIEAAAQAMGLLTRTEDSRLSASCYVYVTRAPDDGQDWLKIRCSDHADKHGGSDWQHWADTTDLAETIARLAAHFECPVPAKYAAEAYAARSAAAAGAAATRRESRRATEAEMFAAVILELLAAKTPGAVAAGRIVDQIYPDIARALRQRLANSASDVVVRERALAAAAGNEAALLKLATRYDAARSALFALVGAERFAALRPAGYPRSSWKV